MKRTLALSIPNQMHVLKSAQGENPYSGNGGKQRMSKILLFVMTISFILIVGCSAKPANETSIKAEPGQQTQPAAQQEIVATINGAPITQEDLRFYEVINRIQIALYKERDQAIYTGAELERVMKFWDEREKEAKHPNALLTQVIRLRAMDLLGKEKGYKPDQQEVAKQVNAVKEQYAKSPAVQSMIKEYGEDQFWAKQNDQYQKIVIVNKVQQDVIQKVKEANPKAEQKEINVLAQKKYEELLVSQVSSLQIKIINQNS